MQNNLDLHKIPCFGVAGNFTGHLEQAGEAEDFKNIQTKDQNEPKAVFPTYIPLQSPSGTTSTPLFLSTFPFDSKKIIFPKSQANLQIEPECAIICKAIWQNNMLSDLIPEYFAASNDCSIRKTEAKKISQKKNWGKSSKGLSENLLKIDSFSSIGTINNYSIASFLLRNDQIYTYGITSEIKNYNYIYQKLIKWLIEKFNFQKDLGVAEPINLYLKECNYPTHIMISIGATLYTEFGKTKYLQNNDSSIVVLYPQNKYSQQDIIQMIKIQNYSATDISFLVQKVMC